MPPFLAIGPLTNLQDARSCAAVGFNFLAFSLARGSHRMIPASSIWSIANWLSGPGLVLELNAASLPELDSLNGSLAVAAVLMPVTDWVQLGPEEHRQLAERIQGRSIWLDCREPGQPELLDEAVNFAIRQQLEVRVLVAGESLQPGMEETYALVLHFAEPEAGLAWLQSTEWQPAGVWLGPEMEEAFGLLDYERIDTWLEAWAAQFPER